MYRFITRILISLLALSAVLSCEEAAVRGDGSGYLYVSVQQDDHADIMFRSTDTEQQPFSLKIYDWNDELVAECNDHRMLTEEPLELPTGPYRMTACSADVPAAAFDAPFYSGSTEFEIKEDVVNAIEVTCSLANVKVTASFSEQMKQNFSEYVLTVTNGEGTLVFDSSDASISKEGYFSVTGTLTWTLSLVNTEGKPYQDITQTYTEVSARQHYNFSFDLGEQEEFGGACVEMTFDYSLNPQVYNLLLDFEAGIRPSVTASYDLSREFVFAEGKPGEITYEFSVPGGVSSLVMSHAMLVELGGKGLPSRMELVGLTQSDIDYYSKYGIIYPQVSRGAESIRLDLTGLFGQLSIGVYSFRFEISSLTGKSRTVECTFEVVSAVEVEALAATTATTWAKFVILKAKWYPEEQPLGIGFQYRKQGASEWETVDESLVMTDAASKTYEAEVRGLDAGTSYVFRAISARDTETKEQTFTTEQTGLVPNMGFDLWYKSGNIWYPNANSSEFYWDTANGGSDAVGVYPTSKDESHKKGGAAAAKLESKSVALVGLAAGNIYTGKFVAAKTDPFNPGAELDWGVSFTSRPLALKGWVDYSPGTVNKTNSPYGGMSGKPDIGSVQIFITDWGTPFRISTQTKKFVDVENDAGIIAYGAMDFNKTDGYIEFTIPLTYRSLTRIPKYIVIAASASKYGDYFTGSTSSVMYVDEFTLVYDLDELTEEQIDKIGYR